MLTSENVAAFLLPLVLGLLPTITGLFTVFALGWIVRDLDAISFDTNEQLSYNKIGGARTAVTDTFLFVVVSVADKVDWHTMHRVVGWRHTGITRYHVDKAATTTTTGLRERSCKPDNPHSKEKIPKKDPQKEIRKRKI
jgi:hypothetical protein